MEGKSEKVMREPVDIHKFFKQPNDRLNFNLMLVHENFSEQPTQIDYRHTEILNHKETPVKRDITLPSQQQVKLDLQWLAGKSGVVFVRNMTGLNLRFNPTEEEVAVFAKKNVIVHLKEGDSGMLLPAKTAMYLRPVRPDEVRFESVFGDTVIRLYVFPGS